MLHALKSLPVHKVDHPRRTAIDDARDAPLRDRQPYFVQSRREIVAERRESRFVTGVRLVGAFALAFGLLGYSSFACIDSGSSLCANSRLADYPSPDGRMKVVGFARDCGATTGFSTQASLLSIDADLVNQPGDIVIADNNHGACPSGPGGGPELHVRWLAENRVVITHHPKARLSRAETSRNGITVQHDVF